MFEVGQCYHEDFNVPAYHEPLEGIRLEVEALFKTVGAAWRDSKVKDAKGAIKAADAVRGRCDEVIDQLLADQASIETHQAVAYSLLARHYKRVTAHLANISTAVTGRIEDLDFRR